MQRLIALFIIVALTGGLLGAFTVSELSSSAGAAPPPQQNQGQRVREQNLDASGFIRVHEQGTANVAGTVNVGNLPAVQDVNVVSMPAAARGRLVELGTQMVGPQQNAVFPFADVSDCARMRAMARAPFTGGIRMVTFNTSPDGNTGIPVGVFDNKSESVVDGVSTASALISGPHRFIQLLVLNPNSGVGADITAWIWCQP